MLLKQRMKYKLIKIYPGSPELGTIVEKGYTGYVPEGHSKSLGSWSLANELVENYPEFWQPESEWMSKLTNSPKGSLHWLNTIGGRIAHIGEYMCDNPYYMSEEKCVNWGDTIETNIREVLDYFKDKLK